MSLVFDSLPRIFSALLCKCIFKIFFLFFKETRRLIFFRIIICRIGINRTFIYICIYIFIVVKVIIFFIILIDVFQSRGCIFYLVNQLKEFEAGKVFEKIIIIINFFDKRHFLIRENLLVNKK